MEWEYYVHELHQGDLVTPDTLNTAEVTKMLNWYGAQGWELVSSFDTSQYHGRTYSVSFIFKRTKPSTPPSPSPA